MADGRRVAQQAIIAGAVGLVVDQLRIGRDGTGRAVVVPLTLVVTLP